MSSPLARLRLIHFGGWIVFGDLPGVKPAGWRPRPSMIFLSNYDGDLVEYLAAFGIAAAPGMRWSFGSAEGFPGTRPTRRFIDFVMQRRSVELLQYTAYPGSTVRDIDAAVDVADRVEDLRHAADDPDDERFLTTYHRLLDALAFAPKPAVPSLLSGLWRVLWHRSTVNGLVVVMPIDAGRQEDVTAAISGLVAVRPSVFDRVGGLHFARIATIQVATRSPSKAGLPPAHLLFAAWADGSVDDFAQRLVAGLGDHADTVWRYCSGYPGHEDPRVLASWITRHHLDISLFVGSRSGLTAEEIGALLARRERAFDLVTAVQGRPVADLRRELKSLWL